MPKLIVVILEMIQIEKSQAAIPRQAIQFDIQRKTIGQAGQWIGMGNALAVFEMLQHLFFLAMQLRELIGKHQRQQYHFNRHRE